MTTTTATATATATAADVDADAALRGIDRMLYERARTLLAGVVAGDDDYAIDEIVQRTRIHIWQKSLPKYDPSRGTKVSTYLWQCADNFIKGERRELVRRRTSPISRHRSPNPTDDTVIDHANHAPDRRLDERVEEVAADLLKNPERYLTDAQVKVFRLIQAHPEMSYAELAWRAGYSSSSSVSDALFRIRERVRQIDVEEWRSRRTDDVELYAGGAGRPKPMGPC